MYMLLIPVIFIGVGIAYMVYMNKTNAQAQANFNRPEELAKLEQTKNELMDGEFDYVKEWMEGEKVDAITAMRIPLGVKGHAKEMAKNAAKSMAWAAVGVKAKYNTVEIDQFAVLSGNMLHLLFRDLEGELKNHLVIGPDTLKHARLEKVENSMDSAMKRGMGASLAAKAIDSYTLEYSEEGKDKFVDLYTHLNISNTFGAEAQAKQLQANLVAENFITKLVEVYPNLKVR